MACNARQRIRGRNAPRAGLAAVSIAAILAACGGSGDGVSIGTGQDPDPVIIDFPIAYIKAPIPADDNGEFQVDAKVIAGVAIRAQQQCTYS